MNLNQLRFVRAVASHRSFSRAARECHIGQPSLSTAIAQLEVELGGMLFARTTRQVELTPFGSRLLPLIEGLLGAETELRVTARDWGKARARLIRVGVSPAASMRPIQLAIASYREAEPGTEIVFKECLHADLGARLVAGTIDLAFGIGEVGRAVDTVLLHEEPLVVTVRGGGEPGGAPVAVRSLAAETLIFTQGCGVAEAVQALFRRARVPFREYPGQALSYRVVEEWAELGLGVGILPRSKVSDPATTRRVLLASDGRPATVTTRASWARGRPRTAPERRLADWIAARTGSLARGEATAGRPARSPRGSPRSR